MKEIVAGVKPTPVEMRVETVTAYVNKVPKLKKWRGRMKKGNAVELARKRGWTGKVTPCDYPPRKYPYSPKLKKCHRVMAEKLKEKWNYMHDAPPDLVDGYELLGFKDAVETVSEALEEVNRHHKHPFDRKAFEKIIYGGEK